MNFLVRERRRLRRKYLKRSAHRTFSHTRFDRWLDREYMRFAWTLFPGLLALVVLGPTTATKVLVAIGLVVNGLWCLFVFGEVLRVAARHGDKTYALVTRKYLSKEYRQDDQKPPAHPPIFDDTA